MDRKHVIITTARQHFSRYGYSKTTMDEVARDCEITKPTLYQYFAGKADLFRAVIDTEQQACYALIEEAVARVDSASGRLLAYARIQTESLNKFLNLSEFSRRAFLDLHPEVLRVYAVYRKREEELITRWIADGIQSGEFISLDPDRAARIFYLAIATFKFDALVLQNLNADMVTAEHENLEYLSREIEQFIHIFLNGLLKRNTSI